MNESDTKERFAELEAAGVIVKTGEFRPNRMGMLEPVYVSAVVLGLITEEEAQRRLQMLDDAEAKRDGAGDGRLTPAAGSPRRRRREIP